MSEEIWTCSKCGREYSLRHKARWCCGAFASEDLPKAEDEPVEYVIYYPVINDIEVVEQDCFDSFDTTEFEGIGVFKLNGIRDITYIGRL